MTGVVDAVAEALGQLRGRGVPDGAIGPLTTYRVGGPASVVATVASEGDVAAVARAVGASGLPVLVVGRGSNLLVADAGFPGIAVVLSGTGPFGAVDMGPVVGGRGEITAGAAVPLPTLARRSADAGRRGLEWAVGVPGSVGGGVRMNAGGHGADMAASVVAATIADLTAPPDGDRPACTERSVAGLAYGYRRSSVASTDLVLRARFVTADGDAEEAKATIREIVRWRREHQPGGQNAGSVFTNPPDDSAGRLIEAAGLKGRRWGTATVSTKHANFIQADAGGSADDVRALIDLVRTTVADRTGTELHPEVRMIGFRQPQPQQEVEG